VSWSGAAALDTCASPPNQSCEALSALRQGAIQSILSELQQALKARERRIPITRVYVYELLRQDPAFSIVPQDSSFRVSLD